MSLEKKFYSDNSQERYSRNESEARNRLLSESSFRTNIMLETGELFFSVPRELSLLTEKVLKLERKISAMWKELPRIAKYAYITSLILDEIIETNEMEGLRSTRRQIIEAIDMAEKKAKYKKDQFVEFANLYFELTNEDSSRPESPEDIREIYDAIVVGSISEKDVPDGKLFRASRVA